MRIKLSEEVFNLVHSLSRTEKAYFKKQTLSKESILIHAFDIINATNEYDEKAINKKLKEKGISPDSTYKRLLPALLKMLEQYHHSSTTKLTLTAIFNSIHILLAKNLLSLCKIQVEKGLRLARETKEYNFEVLFLFWRQNLKLRGMKSDIETDEQFHQEIMGAIDKLRFTTIYDYLTLRSGDLRQAYDTKAEGRERVIKEILGHEIFTREPSDEYFIAHYYLLAGAYFSVGKWEETELVCEKLLGQSFDLDELSDKDYIKIVSLMFNVGLIYLLRYKRDKTEKLMPKLKAELERKRIKTRGNYRVNFQFHYELMVLNNIIFSGQLKDALAMAKNLTSDFENLLKKAPINAYHVFCTEVYIYFLLTEYPKAISLVNKVLGNELKDSKFDSEHIRWQELLCHYHAKDKKLFEARWLAQSRYIKKSNSGYKWERKVLKTLKGTFDTSPENRKTSFNDLLQDILNTEKEEIRTRSQGFDMLTWMESMALGKPMAILIKEKYLG